LAAKKIVTEFGGGRGTISLNVNLQVGDKSDEKKSDRVHLRMKREEKLNFISFFSSN